MNNLNTSVLSESLSIIDRDADIAKIIDTTKAEEQSHVHVVYASSGIGKSSLSIKLMHEAFFNDWNIISITTAPINVDDQSSGTLYYEAIWEGVSGFFKNTNQYDLRFETYITQGRNSQVNKKVTNEKIDKVIQKGGIVESFLTPLRDTIKQIYGLGDYDAEQIANAHSAYEQSIKREYIRHILSREKVLLIVDNLQNIDAKSLRYLSDWIAESKAMGHCFLFEYTLSEKHSVEDVERLCETIYRAGVNVYYSELEKLDKCYIPELLERRLDNRPTHISFNRNALEHYINSNGNIRELLDYARRYKYSKNTEITSSTMANIFELSAGAKNILSTLIMMGGTLDLKLLNQLWIEVIGENDKQLYIEELKKWDFIQLEDFDTKMGLAHASIRDQWRTDNGELKTLDLIIYHGLVNYFDKKLHMSEDNEEKENAWQVLLRLHAQINPTKIADLMDSFQHNFIAKLSVEKTWEYLSGLINHTKTLIKSLQSVYYDIVKICYESYLFDEGFSCLELMEKELPLVDNHYLLLQKLMYMSVLDMHLEAIELANKFIGNFQISSRIRVNMNLILLHCYISINNINKCFEIDRELRSIPRLKVLPEYPLFLRLANIYMPTRRSAKLAKKSISIFSKKRNQRQAAKSLITYAKLLATSGQYKRGLKYIRQAEIILAQEQLGTAYVFHNKAAFMMLEGIYSEQVRLYIELAEDYVRTPYDQLCVITNQLAWYHAVKEYTLIDLLEYRSRGLLQKEPDRYMHAVVHYNFAVILTAAGRKDDANIHFREAKRLMEHCIYVKLRLDRYAKAKDRAIKSRLKQPCHISFLSYWHYDLPDDLRPNMQFPQNID